MRADYEEDSGALRRSQGSDAKVGLSIYGLPLRHAPQHLWPARRTLLKGNRAQRRLKSLSSTLDRRLQTDLPHGSPGNHLLSFHGLLLFTMQSLISIVKVASRIGAFPLCIGRHALLPEDTLS
jgi:hypothetical protein